MNALKKRTGTLLALVLGALGCSVASAAAVVMDFDALTFGPPSGFQQQYVDNYYNGGCGGSFLGDPVDCSGPDYGVVWVGAKVGKDTLAANEPSSPNAMSFQSRDLALMNVAAGFDTGFSFYYSNFQFPSSFVTVYSGLNGTGTVLATLSLSNTGSFCDDSYAWSCWSPIGVSFAGIAMSVDFGPDSPYMAFDDVTIGSATPGDGNGSDVPEPTALGVFGLGILLIGLFAGLRRRFV